MLKKLLIFDYLILLPVYPNAHNKYMVIKEDNDSHPLKNGHVMDPLPHKFMKDHQEDSESEKNIFLNQRNSDIIFLKKHKNNFIKQSFKPLCLSSSS